MPDSQKKTRAPLLARRPESYVSAINRPRLTLFFFLAVGALVSVRNARFPVARNALDYMKAALEIIARHYDVISVAHEHGSIGGKPLMFSLVAAPFVWLLGGNSGIIATSAVGTSVFLMATMITLGRLSRINGDGRSNSISLGLIFTALNPLVLYQFWSGYPDSLFSGLVLLAFILSDSIVENDGPSVRKKIVLLGLTICLAFHIKLYGIVLLLTCPLYILTKSNWKSGSYSWSDASTILFLVVWTSIFIVLIISKLGYDPLLVFDSNSGFGEYVAILHGSVMKSASDSMQILFFFTLLSFHVALMFILKREAWSIRSIAPVMFIGVYCVGLLPSAGTGINMRYFLPVLPFVASGLASGASVTSSLGRRAVLCSYSLIAVALALNFNVAQSEKITHNIVAAAYGRYPILTRWLDNLRMPVHIALKNQIDTINANVPDGSILYWSSEYYKTATHGLAYHLGVKRSLDVRYVLEPSYPQYSDHPVFLTEFTSTAPPDSLWWPPKWATPVSYGQGLFRLDPASIQLTSLSGDFVPTGAPLEVRADIDPRDPYTVREVEFVESGAVISKSHRRPFEMRLSDPAPGRHEIIARVAYVERSAVTSAPIDIYVGAPTLERIAGDIDELISEDEDGLEHASQDVLFLDKNFRIEGIRFRNISVQRGARLAGVHLWFTSARAEEERTVLDIRAEFSPNAEGFRLIDWDLASRPATTSHIIWEPTPWRDGQKVESPDLTTVVEQVLSRNDWRSGNSLLLLFRVEGKRRLVRAGKEGGRDAPRLQITLKQ